LSQTTPFVLKAIEASESLVPRELSTKWIDTFHKIIATSGCEIPTAGIKRFGRSTVPETMDDINEALKFVNRTNECWQLVKACIDIDRQRGSGLHARGTLGVRVPVCTGMPGIGKTTFARHAIMHLAEKRLPKDPGAPIDFTEIAAKIVQEYATTPDPVATDTMCQLLMACNQGRNLRIAGDVDSFRAYGLQFELAVSLFAQWVQPAVPTLESRSVLQKLRDTMPTTLTVKQAVRFMLGTHQGPCGMGAAVILNIDEAHKYKDLHAMIDACVACLTEHNFRVFVTITGVHAAEIAASVDASRAGAVDIVLPLLTVDHMTEILCCLFSKSVSQLSMPLQSVMWWLGGVPRYLEYFLRAAGDQSGLHELSKLFDWLLAASINVLMDVVMVVATKDLCFSNHPREVFQSIVALTVSGLLVPETLFLEAEPRFFGHSHYTIGWAQRCGLLYWERCEGVLGIVRMPPLVQHYLQCRFGNESDLVDLDSPPAYLHPKDNEALVAITMLHKCFAFHLANPTKTQIRLDTLCPLFPTLYVNLPTDFRLEVLDTQVDTVAGMRALIKTVRSADYCGPIAFVNGHGASPSDAFIIFQQHILFIQGNQSVKACQQFLSNKTAAGVDTGKPIITTEYDKIFQHVRTQQHSFIFFTDETADERPKKTLVFAGREEHVALMGEFVTDLRKYHWEDSEVRLESAAAAFD
jgi:hypothetical protein